LVRGKEKHDNNGTRTDETNDDRTGDGMYSAQITRDGRVAAGHTWYTCCMAA